MITMIVILCICLCVVALAAALAILINTYKTLLQLQVAEKTWGFVTAALEEVLVNQDPEKIAKQAASMGVQLTREQINESQVRARAMIERLKL